MTDIYCYEDCDVLRNKLGIKDKIVLDKAEVDFACNAIHELLVCPLEGKYDFQHFCNFHKLIFCDIYEWAGKTRTVKMEKAEPILGYMSIEYAVPNKISSEGQKILDEMNSKKWEKMSLEEQAKNLSRDMASLWKIHPFREGNTRTTILFICQFADSKNMFISRELFTKNPAYMRDALVAASAVFQDVDLRKPEYLENIVKDSLERGRSMAFPCE